MIGRTTVADVNAVLPITLEQLRVHGVQHTAASTANQRATLEYPGVFITEYTDPRKCVLVDPVRDCNPFFHYLEAMWIIKGRQDVKFLAAILPKMAEYSDDGKVFNAPYGFRLRNHFGILPDSPNSLDQIAMAIDLLKAKPTSRQVVMGIWDPSTDLGTVSKDPPCNDLLMLKVRDGKLNLTVCNRSNDAIWGAYGANVVQFSMLLMYMAAKIGVGVGRYTQVSDSMHVYLDTPYWQAFVARREAEEKGEAGGLAPKGFSLDGPLRSAVSDFDTPYAIPRAPVKNKRMKRAFTEIGSASDELPWLLDGEKAGALPTNLFGYGTEHIDDDLTVFFQQFDGCPEGKAMGYYPGEFQSRAVSDAARIWNAYQTRKHDMLLALNYVGTIESQDWQTACREWLERRT